MTPIGTTKGGPALGDKRLVTSSKLRVNLATIIFFTNMVHHRVFCIHQKYMLFTIKFSFYQRYMNVKSRVFHNDKNTMNRGSTNHQILTSELFDHFGTMNYDS